MKHATISLENDALPVPIQKHLTDLELRHKRHEAMLDAHHERRYQAREAHRRGDHRNRYPIYTLK